MPPKRRLIVALPAYNEEDCLPGLLARFRKLFARHPEWDGIVIVVDDGSRDRTAEVTLEWAGKMPVRLVRHEKNKGLGEAIKTGLRSAAALSTSPDDVLVCMDADNTHPPRHVPSMMREIERGADMVIASRYRPGSEQHGVPLHRMAMSYGALLLFSIFLRIPGVRDYTCGFRAYRMDLIQRALAHYGDTIITREGFACTDQLLVNLACLGARVREVPFILRYDRKIGESKIRLGLTIIETMHLLVDGRRKLRKARRESYYSLSRS